MDRKLKVYTSINDLFNTQKGCYEMIGGNYYSGSYYETVNSRSISLGITSLVSNYKLNKDNWLELLTISLVKSESENIEIIGVFSKIDILINCKKV
jgi:hypothetical protein